MTPTTPSIALVGMGPRGISLVERLGAHLLDRPPAPIELHLIDDSDIGAGRIWDTSQTKTLCMNTLAGAVTLFTEPTSTTTAPVVEGPTLYEWIQLLRGESAGIAPAKKRLFDSHPASVAPAFAAELATTRPESNPSRALYGAYLHWVYEVALAQLPDSVTVLEHHSRVISVAQAGDHDVLTLSDGSHVSATATALAYGWQVPALTDSEAHLAESGLHWVRPDNPVEQPLSEVPAGIPVLVRGLGMGFFDAMALLTIGRGGIFHEDSSTRSGLRYEPSGREPHLVVSSGRGYPYLPKSEYHSLPPAANLPRFSAALASLGPEIDFGTEVLPHLLRDAYAAYYQTQDRVAPAALKLPLPEILTRLDAAPITSSDFVGACREINAALAGVSTDPLDLAHWVRPFADFSGGSVDDFLASALAHDIAEAVAAADSPLKAALWTISAARKPASIAASPGRLTWDSRSDSYSEFMAFGQMVGSGPPLFRTRELLALVEARLVSFLGPHPNLTFDDTEFTLSTKYASASSPWLIDAWMHQPDIRHSTDPLALSLAGRVRAFRDHERRTGSPETTWERLVVHPDGGVDKRLHILGIPTYAQWPDTTISPMPGTDPLMLQETDRTAGSLLQAARG
ncbi:FAD/NAD(P)-binding protein [Corynebacterium flavescens]|uniref:FAD/NAD(P)-binding protein n=1 Tax=Corynebacterium flavescens TaxID=28028 RepID=UPI002897495D|nr:FAD/NAD(P)-binding protein [Corynebacterium flavescens]